MIGWSKAKPSRKKRKRGSQRREESIGNSLKDWSLGLVAQFRKLVFRKKRLKRRYDHGEMYS